MYKTSAITSERLPLVVEPISPMKKEEYWEFLKSESPFIKSRLLTEGALLLRNFPTDQVDDFIKTLDILNLGKSVNYIGGGAPRNIVKNAVYTSTEAPPKIKIPLHNELSYSKNYPNHIYFYCEIPPQEKGETIIGDARKIYAGIDDQVKKLFVEKGIHYISNYWGDSPVMKTLYRFLKGHRSWKSAFETEDKRKVEALCRQNEMDYKWNGDWLQIRRKRLATHAHPITKESVWFNQVHTFDYNPRYIGWPGYLGMKLFYLKKNTMVSEVFFGDGSRIPREVIYHLHDVLNKNTIYFPWKKGDILLLDNILAMHGRAPFQGKRRILTAMTH